MFSRNVRMKRWLGRKTLGAALGVSILGLMAGERDARANDYMNFYPGTGGATKNLYVDLVFLGPNCAPGGPTTGCFTSDPNPKNDDRQKVLGYVINLANWLNGVSGADGSSPPPGLEPAIHFYGLSGITPGVWLNDPMTLESDYIHGSGTRKPDDDLFRPIVSLAQNGTLGPAYDYYGNMAYWGGIPTGANRLMLIITKGTNDYCISIEILASCSDDWGYHDTASGYPFGAVMFEHIAPALSHEVVEAMSDPIRRQGIQIDGDNPTGWYARNGTFSTNEIADECENQSTGPYAQITVNPMYSVAGVATPLASCRLTIPEQHAPLAATVEWVNGAQKVALYYVSPGGHMNRIEWAGPGQPASAPADLGPPSPTVNAVGKPSLVQWQPTIGETVFVRGSDGAVWMLQNNTWKSLGGVIYGDPAAVAWSWNGATWLHVFALGLDDHLYGQGVLNGQPYGWGQIPSGYVYFSGSPAVMTRNANALDVFAVGEDGMMRQPRYTQTDGWIFPGPINTDTYYNPNLYYDYMPTGPFVTTPAVAPLGASDAFQLIGGYAPLTYDSGMDVAQWTDQNYWLTFSKVDAHLGMDGRTTWITPFYDLMPKSASTYTLQGTPAILTSGIGSRVDVFVADRGGQLWWFYTPYGGAFNQDWYSVSMNGSNLVTSPPGDFSVNPTNPPLVRGGVTGDPQAIRRDAQNIEVFYRTDLGGLAHLMLNEGNKTWNSEVVLQPIVNSNIIYDPPQPNGSAHQCYAGGVWMHCCPSGYVMVGANISNNQFKCAATSMRIGTPTGVAGPWSPQQSMHSCPYGQLMVGLRSDQNILACVTLPAGVTIPNERIDSSTQDQQQPMHACDAGTPTGAMAGIDVGNNLLNCAATAQIQ